MTYTIRREELPAAVLALDEICFPEDYRITTAEALWWVVWCGRRPVGYGGLRPCREAHNRGMGFLCRAGVIREHRGRGLQKRLIVARERVARRMGLKRLVTYCVPYNAASINSLISCGYRVYCPGTKWGGAGAIYFGKNLTKKGY